ncbi:homoserine O-succinyltransferase [Candidatus Epulonipiscium fishelsonii]|uniref:Homoserine O-succinyltransferase n=1 Tax=Candidatus Epulonipiscium fishelsonii TaxID=77094 RepID=A0ACC8XCB4_9FIRM|nr:homoserine O-succinyltransferase [Epulopiscium sp. SCG-D08WGA-EpuloA1]
MSTHKSKNSPKSHLDTFYKDFEEIKYKKYDGMIITGAPVETLNFDEVDYWNELKKILEFAKTQVYSTMFICWGAQAGLYYYYNLNKISLNSKVFGVFEHKVLHRTPIVRGFDDVFFAPHSRHTTWNIEDIERIPDIEVIADSKEAGAYIVTSKNQRFIFISGHPEYDPDILEQEYKRDLSLNLNINIPSNYYINNEPNKAPIVKWRGHANLLFANWLNYHVYQETPFEFL